MNIGILVQAKLVHSGKGKPSSSYIPISLIDFKPPHAYRNNLLISFFFPAAHIFWTKYHLSSSTLIVVPHQLFNFYIYS